MDTAVLIAIISPLLLTIGGWLTWMLKAKREESLAQEEKTRQFRINTYETLLEPYYGLFTFNLPEKLKDKEIQKIATIEYKKAAFNLTTFGSDEVVRSFNDLMQTYYHKRVDQFPNKTDFGVHMLRVFSNFLLAIRKDLYSKNTKLKRSQLVEFMITDIDNYRNTVDK
jgi:hypothetical protein